MPGGTPHREPFTVRRSGDTADDRRAFARVLTPYLARREAHNNLQLAVLDGVAAGRYADALLLLAEDANGDTVACVVRTPPHALLIPVGCAPAALEALLEQLLVVDAELPGMVGPLPDVAEAARWWSARTGRRAHRRMHEGVHRLRALTPAHRAPGRARPAEAKDRDLVIGWLDAFAREAMPGAPRRDPALLWDSFGRGDVRRIELWDAPDGRTVSLAATSGRTPNGVRIGPVYTPPDARRRGYASALVASLSGAHLAAGHRFCFLYTDLANETSNRIYRDIGYERIGEAAEYAFDG